MPFAQGAPYRSDLSMNCARQRNIALAHYLIPFSNGNIALAEKLGAFC
jgi:hypothetical protein